MVDPGSKRYEGQVINLGVRGGFKTQVTEIFHLRGTPAPLNEWSVVENRIFFAENNVFKWIILNGKGQGTLP